MIILRHLEQRLNFQTRKIGEKTKSKPSKLREARKVRSQKTSQVTGTNGSVSKRQAATSVDLSIFKQPRSHRQRWRPTVSPDAHGHEIGAPYWQAEAEKDAMITERRTFKRASRRRRRKSTASGRPRKKSLGAPVPLSRAALMRRASYNAGAAAKGWDDKV